jgi:hypothetical protein
MVTRSKPLSRARFLFEIADMKAVTIAQRTISKIVEPHKFGLSRRRSMRAGCAATGCRPVNASTAKVAGPGSRRISLSDAMAVLFGLIVRPCVRLRIGVTSGLPNRDQSEAASRETICRSSTLPQVLRKSSTFWAGVSDGRRPAQGTVSGWLVDDQHARSYLVDAANISGYTASLTRMHAAARMFTRIQMSRFVCAVCSPAFLVHGKRSRCRR